MVSSISSSSIGGSSGSLSDESISGMAGTLLIGGDTSVLALPMTWELYFMPYLVAVSGDRRISLISVSDSTAINSPSDS